VGFQTLIIMKLKGSEDDQLIAVACSKVEKCFIVESWILDFSFSQTSIWKLLSSGRNRTPFWRHLL